MAQDHLELRVTVKATRRNYAVRVSDPSRRQSRVRCRGAFPQGNGVAELTESAKRVDPHRRFGSNQANAVEHFGTTLFNNLFFGPTLRSYRRSMDLARERDAVLRVVLDLDDDLERLPWEYLYDSQRGSFLAGSRETSLVRAKPTNDVTRTQGPIKRLRILSMGASPAGTQPLDLHKEQRLLVDALAGSVETKHADLRFVKGATLAALDQAIRDFNPHLFHFSGHGYWRDDRQDGVLQFEDAAGFAHSVDGRTLGAVLNQTQLRLAVLNSCHSARSAPDDRFAGVGSCLIAQGIPAVVGMQFRFDNAAALVFGTVVLRELAAGSPLDRAVGDARLAVLASPSEIEWGTPVLTTRIPVAQVLPRIQGLVAAPSDTTLSRGESQLVGGVM